MEPTEVRSGPHLLPAAIYRPLGTAPKAGLLIAPGGLAKGELEAYAWAGERFARAGLAALVLTYQAGTPYGDAEDVIAALERLAQVAGVGAERIAAVGHSRGGLGVLGAAAIEPRLKAVVSIAAPAGLRSYVEAVASFSPAVRDAIVQFMGGEPDKLAGQYESVSPLHLAPRIRQPVLLVHGTADMRVPFHHSQQLEATLRAAGNTDVRLEAVPGMGHYFELGTMGYQFDRVVDLVYAWLSSRV